MNHGTITVIMKFLRVFSALYLLHGFIRFPVRFLKGFCNFKFYHKSGFFLVTGLINKSPGSSSKTATSLSYSLAISYLNALYAISKSGCFAPFSDRNSFPLFQTTHNKRYTVAALPDILHIWHLEILFYNDFQTPD